MKYTYTVDNQSQTLEYAIGDRVFHHFHGWGTVVNLDEEWVYPLFDEDMKPGEIWFGGEKTLMLQQNGKTGFYPFSLIKEA